jgi:outer membrane protein OmpA-like peptidoglycan-associated protein
MHIRTLLLASALPLAVTAPAFAAQPFPVGSIILAQAEPCAPDDAACLQQLQQQQQQERQKAPAEPAPAPEAAPEPEPQQAEPEPAPEPAPEPQQAAPEPAPEPQAAPEQAAPEPAPEPQAEPAPEAAPAAEAAPEPAPEPEAPAAQQEPPPLPPAEAPAEQPAEQPAAEQPAAEQPAADQPADAQPQGERRRRQQDQQAQPDQAPAPADQQAQPEQPAPGETQQQAAPAEPAQETIVEQQLEAQGDSAEADKVRELRRKLFRERPADDQQAAPDQQEPRQEQTRDGQRRDGDRRDGDQARDGDRDRDGGFFRRGRDRDRDRDREGEIVERRGDQIIIRLGDQLFIESTIPDEGDRLLYGANDVEVRELRGGRTETTVYRENGSQIVTVRNRYGDIETRIRRTRDGREIVLLDNRYPDEPAPVIYFERELPPLVVEIPREQYIVETRQANQQQIYTAFSAPPVEAVERPYTLQEITRSERLRDKVRRIDLDTITFEFGSSTIGVDQMAELGRLGEAIEQVLAEDPNSVFLIEGHTDAVGSDYDNLLLSDRRAEAVAVALSQNFDIPPENLVTEGYGEQYLKVATEAAERENRRVTMRNITELMAASN